MHDTTTPLSRGEKIKAGKATAAAARAAAAAESAESAASVASAAADEAALEADRAAAAAEERAAGRDPHVQVDFEAADRELDKMIEPGIDVLGETGAAAEAMVARARQQAAPDFEDIAITGGGLDMVDHTAQTHDIPTPTRAVSPSPAGDPGILAGARVEPGIDQAEFRRTGEDTARVNTADEIDRAMGTFRRANSYTPDWAHVQNYGHLTFSRFYYEKPLTLIDRFPSNDRETQQEVWHKIAVIQGHNMRSRPEQRVGYLAYVVGAEPSLDLIARAKGGEVVSQIAVPWAAERNFESPGEIDMSAQSMRDYSALGAREA